MGKLARLNAERRGNLPCFATADIYGPNGREPIIHGHEIPLSELREVATTILTQSVGYFGKHHIVFECGLEDIDLQLRSRTFANSNFLFPMRTKLVFADVPEWLSGIRDRAFEALELCLQERPYPCGRIDVFCANSNELKIESDEDFVRPENLLEITSVEDLLKAQKLWNKK